MRDNDYFKLENGKPFKFEDKAFEKIDNLTEENYNDFVKLLNDGKIKLRNSFKEIEQKLLTDDTKIVSTILKNFYEFRLDNPREFIYENSDIIKNIEIQMIQNKKVDGYNLINGKECYPDKIQLLIKNLENINQDSLKKDASILQNYLKDIVGSCDKEINNLVKNIESDSSNVKIVRFIYNIIQLKVKQDKLIFKDSNKLLVLKDFLSSYIEFNKIIKSKVFKFALTLLDTNSNKIIMMGANGAGKTRYSQTLKNTSDINHSFEFIPAVKPIDLHNQHYSDNHNNIRLLTSLD